SQPLYSIRRLRGSEDVYREFFRKKTDVRDNRYKPDFQYYRWLPRFLEMGCLHRFRAARSSMASIASSRQVVDDAIDSSLEGSSRRRGGSAKWPPGDGRID
ncbi:MAG: hypothetical protein ACK53L_16655, partial [Pirellulaceae bacterium]